MALDGTYTGLQATIADWLNRADLTAAIADYIVLTESRIRRLVKTKNITRDTTIVLNAATVVMPTDVKELRLVELTDAVYKGTLGVRSMPQLADLKSQYAVAGVPRFFAVVNNTLHLVPTPATSYTAQITYEPELAPLVTTPTNWLLTNHPDIYLYGALVEASPFLRDDPRVEMFNVRFEKAIMELELARDRAEFPNTPVMRPRRTLG